MEPLGKRNSYRYRLSARFIGAEVIDFFATCGIATYAACLLLIGGTPLDIYQYLFRASVPVLLMLVLLFRHVVLGIL